MSAAGPNAAPQAAPHAVPADAEGIARDPFRWPVSALRTDTPAAAEVRAALDAKTKPPGSLGALERLALQVATVQARGAPRIAHAQVCVFAGDHGVAAQGVSAYPSAVTAQMVANFLAGGAAICVLARECGATLRVVDAGVDADLPPHPQLIDLKLGRGTADFSAVPAMPRETAAEALRRGFALGAALPAHGAFVAGEMGIGNSASAAALMHALTGRAVEDCVGRGTGVDDAGLARKRAVVAAAVARHGRDGDALDALARYGGFEIATMAGAMIGAAAARQVVVVDGFIGTAAAAVALALCPALHGYCVFAHVSAEGPHRAWLADLGAAPLLDLGLRLGEASGAVLALPLLRAACAILTDMATFAEAGVAEREGASP